MTKVDAKRSRGRAAADRIRASGYAEIFDVPGSRRFSAACFVGRMPMSMVGLGVILAVSSVTGRYGTAGTVSAVGSLCYAVIAPQIGRLVDRIGQGPVLRPLGAAFGVSAALFIICLELRAPLWTLFVTGALFLSTMPPLGSMVRARWTAALGDSPLLHTAFSFESVADEMIFVTGPAAITILATEVRPSAGIAVAAVLAIAGTYALSTLSATAPLVATERRDSGAAFRTRGVVVLMVVFAALGALFGTLDLTTVAFAAEHGVKPVAGLILGTAALGSATGGLWYGARQWRAPLHRRFVITLTLMVAGLAPLWAMPGVPELWLMIFVSGLAISPTLIGGYSLIERKMPRELLNEGMTMLTTAIGLGLAVGPPVAGRLIDAHGARWGYLFLLGCGVVAMLAALLGARRLR